MSNRIEEARIRRSIYHVGGFTLSEVYFPPNLYLSKHTHDSGCFGLTLRGSMVEAFGSRPLECTPRTVLARPSHEDHFDQVGGAGAKVFAVEVPELWIAHVREHGMILSEPRVCASIELTRLLRCIHHEVERSDAASALAIQSLIFEMAARLVRESITEGRSPTPAWLRRVKDKLDASYAERLTLTDLARDAGVHSVHLARTFRRYYSMSVGEYVRHQRIQAAARDIEKGDGSFADIALRAGFSSQAHFCTIFKQVKGRTPSEFRQSKR